MKTLPVALALVALALGTFAQGALAGGPDCRAIESAGGRLACYDAAFPPKTKKPVTTDNGMGEYKDPAIADDAKLSARLKNICRGC